MKRYLILSLLAIVLVALPLMVACGEDETETTTTAAAVTTTAGGATETTGGATTTAAPAETSTTVGEPVPLDVGGTFAMTGAYVRTAAVLAGSKDYVST